MTALKKTSSNVITYAHAVARLEAVDNGFTIDEESYTTYKDKCIISCKKCSQRMEAALYKFIKNPSCVRCTKNAKRRYGSIFPELRDLEFWLESTDSALDPAEREKNESRFLAAKNGEAPLELFLHCRNHPDYFFERGVSRLQRKDAVGCCPQYTIELRQAKIKLKKEQSEKVG
jgi:hypothetical protein